MMKDNVITIDWDDEILAKTGLPMTANCTATYRTSNRQVVESG